MHASLTERYRLFSGGNALFLSKHVTRSGIAGSEFVRIGDSAISLVGDAHEVNVVRKGDATAPGLFPERNTIELNHIHEVGITGKGMAGIFQSIARSNVVRRNVLYNGPRAGALHACLRTSPRVDPRLSLCSGRPQRRLRREYDD